VADTDQEHRVAAGSLTFTVERRALDPGKPDQSGPTIRVLGTDDGHEYLRFDMFKAGAHYHYEPPGAASERRVMLDTVAEGDPLEWVVDRLRNRLGPMLTEAGGGSLLGGADGDALHEAIAVIEKQLRA
jgi:hypothetical protein